MPEPPVSSTGEKDDAPTGVRVPLRLLTLNIRYGSGAASLDRRGYDLPSPASNLKALAEAITAVDPDLVALQEVKTQHQAERLAGLTARHSVYMSHPVGYRLNFFEWGLAFLYRGTVLETRGRPLLVEAGTGVGRSALLCAIRYRDVTVRFVNVHFDIADRERQLMALLNWVAEIDPPVIILGDFNAAPADPLLKPLQDRLTEAASLVASHGSRESDRTGSLLHKPIRVDSIWLDADRFRVAEAALLPQAHRLVSDHIGYYIEIELKQGKSLSAPPVARE